MGEWHKVELRPYSPCDGCEAGSCGVSSWTDPKTGELWTKTDDCHETCTILSEYLKGNMESSSP